MNINQDYYLRTYKEHIRDSFSGFGRKGLLNKLVNAIDLYNKDQYEKAIKTLLSLKKKCKTVNEHCALLTFIALCYDELHYFTPAIDACREILALDPSRSTVHSNLGLLYRRMGEYSKAIGCFHAAIEQDPNNPYAYNNLGLTYYRMAEYEAAVKHCEKALVLKGNLYQAANCLCLCHFIAQNMEECKRYYKIAVTNGGNPATLKEEIKKLREGMMLSSDDDLWWDL